MLMLAHTHTPFAICHPQQMLLDLTFIDAASGAVLKSIHSWDPTSCQSHIHTFCVRAHPPLLFTFHVEEHHGSPHGVAPSLHIEWMEDGDERIPVVHVDVSGGASPCSAEVSCGAIRLRVVLRVD